MNSFELKKEEIKIRTNYSVVREPGVYQPDKKGRTILTLAQMVELFKNETEPRRLLGLAQWITGTHLENTLNDERFVADDRSHIVNQHFDFAQTVLLHHKKVFGNFYQGKIDIFEKMRGEFLRQVVELSDATVTNGLEYAYWLSGYSDKFAESDPVKSGNFRKDAEAVLRQIHDAGSIEATEALAAMLYTESDLSISEERRKEAISLWEKAAATGHVTALNNLFNVLSGDEDFSHEERTHSLMAVWEGISANPEGSKAVVKLMKNEGYYAVAALEDILSPR